MTSWLKIPDLGRTLSAVAPMPVTAPAQTPGGASAHLEYAVFLFDSGAVKVDAYLSPTLNFSGAADGAALRRVVRRRGAAGRERAAGLVDARVGEAGRGQHQHHDDATHVGQGRARTCSKFWAVDPGVVLQKIVIEARDVAPSYLGPPESFHRP